MLQRENINPKIDGLVELYSFAVQYLIESTKRPDWVQHVLIRPFKDLGEGSDIDSQWIRLRALQISAQLMLDFDRAGESIPLFKECMDITSPDDDLYYLDSMGLLRALVRCDRLDDAITLLVDLVETGIANRMKRNDLCGQFSCLGSDLLRSLLSRPQLQSACIAFLTHFHDMNEAETLKLLDEQPDRAIELLTVYTQDLKP